MKRDALRARPCIRRGTGILANYWTRSQSFERLGVAAMRRVVALAHDVAGSGRSHTCSGPIGVEALVYCRDEPCITFIADNRQVCPGAADGVQRAGEGVVEVAVSGEDIGEPDRAAGAVGDRAGEEFVARAAPENED